MVPNLVVDIDFVNFCLFVYLSVCSSQFANFAKGKWSNHDSKNCSEIRTTTSSVIWLWKLQFAILIFFNQDDQDEELGADVGVEVDRVGRVPPDDINLHILNILHILRILHILHNLHILHIQRQGRFQNITLFSTQSFMRPT